MHLTEPSALLKTPPAKVMDTKDPGASQGRIVEPFNKERHTLLGDSEDATTSDDAGRWQKDK